MMRETFGFFYFHEIYFHSNLIIISMVLLVILDNRFFSSSLAKISSNWQRSKTGEKVNTTTKETVKLAKLMSNSWLKKQSTDIKKQQAAMSHQSSKYQMANE